MMNTKTKSQAVKLAKALRLHDGNEFKSLKHFPTGLLPRTSHLSDLKFS